MSQENIEGLKRASSAMNWVVGFVAALVVYVVSPGPVTKLLEMNGIKQYANSIADKSLGFIYAPLNWGCEHNNLVRKFYQWEFKSLGIP